VLEKLKAGAASESLSLELDDKWLSILDLEAHVEMVGHHFFGEVHNHKVHLLARCELTCSRLNLEDVLVENLLFKRLFHGRSSGIDPRLHLDFRIVGELEAPVGLDTANILDGNGDSSCVLSLFGWNLAEVP